MLFCVVPPPSQGFLHVLLEDQAACRRSRRGFPRWWCKPVLDWCASVWLVKPGAYEQMAAGRVLSLPSVQAVKRHANLTQSASGHSRELLERVKQAATRLETAKQREVSLPVSLGGAAPGRRARARAHNRAILMRGARRLQSKVTGGEYAPLCVPVQCVWYGILGGQQGLYNGFLGPCRIRCPPPFENASITYRGVGFLGSLHTYRCAGGGQRQSTLCCCVLCVIHIGNQTHHSQIHTNNMCDDDPRNQQMFGA